MLVQLGQQQYSYLYWYSQIALIIARAITGHTRASKSTDYCPNHIVILSLYKSPID